MEVYPNAKVILTTRDPTRWHQSVLNTIIASRDAIYSFSGRIFLHLVGGFKFSDMAQRLSNKPISELGGVSLIQAGRSGSAEAADFFEAWNEEVRRSVPKEQLLEFEVKDGWKPLCDFLDLPVPDEPFPNVNDSKAMSRTIKNFQWASYSESQGRCVTFKAVA